MKATSGLKTKPCSLGIIVRDGRSIKRVGRSGRLDRWGRYGGSNVVIGGRLASARACALVTTAILTLPVFGCGSDVATPSKPVHLQALLVTTASGGASQLFGAGFGDSTLRSWSVDQTLTLDQILWAGGSTPPVGAEAIGPTEVDGLAGAWGLAETSSGAVVLASKLAGTVVLLSAGSGPLRVINTVTQGDLVQSSVPTRGLVTVRGLDRVGSVETEPGWLYTAGLDGLGVFSVAADRVDFVAQSADLAGVDDLVAVSTAASPRGRIVVSRCRRHSVEFGCLSELDESELVVAHREATGAMFIESRWTYDADGRSGKETLLGNGSLVLAAAADGGPLVLAAFEGAAAVVGLRLSSDGVLTSTGTKRVVAPWQDATALPAFDAPAASTSTLAPLRSGQIALVGQTVFAAIRSGGFVAHFPLSCLGQPTPTDGCLEVTCLDEVGGCAGPSDASATATYPYAVVASGSRVFVGVDVRGADGAITTRIAILDFDGETVTLVGFVDA